MEGEEAPAERAPLAANALGRPELIERCATLRREGRLVEAIRAARAALVADGAPGPLLIELSRAQASLGRLEDAIDMARDAHFVWRSRESVEYLIRLLTRLHRFAPEDGASLRHAIVRHPKQPPLRYAAGVCEVMHGDPREAEKQLRVGLALDEDRDQRAAIERDLSEIALPGKRN